MSPRAFLVGALVVSGAVLSAAAQQGPVDAEREMEGDAAEAAPPASAAAAVAADPDYRAFVLTRQRKQVEARLARVVSDERRIEHSTLSRGRAYVRMMRLGLLPLSDGFSGMVAHANRAERLRRSLARDMVEATRLKREEKQLRVGLQQVKQRDAQGPAHVLDYQRTREAIEAARERELAYRRAFERDYSQPDDHTAVYGATPKTDTLSGSFAEGRGHMLFPIKGRSEMRTGTVPGADGPGLVVKAPRGAEVLSVFRGKVILAGDYGELGLGVVIDHGGGYTTLLAHLANLVAEVGDEVAAGDVIGELGGSGDALLYFEIRHQGIAVEPADWFGI